MSTPTVSIVIPCYNHGAFVTAAVGSCLRQRDADIHVVIVDDGSDDGSTPRTCLGLQSDAVTVVRQENKGLPAARNRGALEAQRHRADYLVFLDADDWIEPTFVRDLYDAIIGAGDDVSHAYCQERLVELGTGVWRVPEWDPLTLMVTNLHPVTALVRRDRFEAVGGFDESMTDGYEDWDFWLKFVERGWRGVRVREPLFVWRRHSHDTMVMQVIHNHEALYRRIMENHRELFAQRQTDLLIRSNMMLRRFDVNWIDETGEPIPLRALRRAPEEYEQMVAVRLHHLVHRLVRLMPAPLGRLCERAIIAVRNAAPGPRRMLPDDLPTDRLHSV